MAEEHQIASHSWSHENFIEITPQQRQDQIIKFEMAMVNIVGVFPTYIRTPYDKSNEEVLKELNELGYHIVRKPVFSSSPPRFLRDSESFTHPGRH